MYSYLDISFFNPHLFNESCSEIVPILKTRIFKNKIIHRLVYKIKSQVILYIAILPYRSKLFLSINI